MGKNEKSNMIGAAKQETGRDGGAGLPLWFHDSLVLGPFTGTSAGEVYDCSIFTIFDLFNAVFSVFFKVERRSRKFKKKGSKR